VRAIPILSISTDANACLVKSVAECITETQRHSSGDADQQIQVSNSLDTLSLIQAELNKFDSDRTGPWQTIKRATARLRHKPSNLNHLWDQLERNKQNMRWV
jgi:hypothetical protein